jgi:glycosyltransferase involved in cell wall biosynthesis
MVLQNKKLFPSIRILYQPNKGKGDAITYGFDDTTSEIVIALDVDGPTDPEELLQFVKPLSHGYEMYIHASGGQI